MQWIGRAWRGFWGSHHRDLVERAGDASLGVVWPLVSHRAGELRPHVARGYIRARAARVVSRAVSNVVLAHGGGRVDTARLERETLERVVDQLAARLARHPRVVERRRAA